MAFTASSPALLISPPRQGSSSHYLYHVAQSLSPDDAMSLNSKKSWHPGKASNKAKVQKLEENEIELRQKAERRRQEVEQERELQKHGNHGTSKDNKIVWMYEDQKPRKPQLTGVSNQRSLLLGTNSIDDKVLAAKQAEARNARGVARKVAADPMAALLAKQASKKRALESNPGKTCAPSGKVTKSKKHR